MNISAVLVTRGDVDLTGILASLPFDDVVVWDNSQREDLATYGRYAGIAEAKHDLIYVQDDDVILEPISFEALVAVATGKGVPPDAPLPTMLPLLSQPDITANMPARFRPHYPDSGLVGFGAIFPRDLPARTFDRWHAFYPEGDEALFRRRCDRVFTLLTPPLTLLDLPYEELPWAHAANRSWKQRGHVRERDRVLEMARVVRDAEPYAGLGAGIAEATAAIFSEPKDAPADGTVKTGIEIPPDGTWAALEGDPAGIEAAPIVPANVRRGEGKIHAVARQTGFGTETLCGLTWPEQELVETGEPVTCSRCLALSDT